ncbi:MAG TPA: aldo/keto reductase [Steroidobacteraceae bacterium]|jgi:aryl-alcohol dehydrogenase-like predicted oxidoreductase
MTGGDRLLSRREALILCSALSASAITPAWSAAQAVSPMRTRRIPHAANETLPVVGVGTAGVFNVGANPPDRSGPTEVVRALVNGGGSLIDTAPSYGDAESVIGGILTATALRPRVFIATKLEQYQRGGEMAEARDSLRRLGCDRVDALQLHNVRDPGQDMGGLNALKAQGLCRYTGITTTYKAAYDAAEAILKRTKPDFLEIDYAIDNRDAEERVLPAAADAGAGVLVALPFGRGKLFRKALGKPLPDWAADFDCASWGQFFLKFILAHPAVTAVIPGTDKAEHMIDNIGAGHGRLPDAKQRTRMVAYVESLG